MKLAIMQPYFMPYIGYFQAISAVDKYILYGNLTFIKDAWMNRNRIRLKNGGKILFSVPLIAKSSNMLIKDVRIDNSKKWKEKLLKSVLINYKRSVAFNEVYQLLEDILRPSYDYLFDLNAQSIISVARFLDIQTEISVDNTKYNSLEKNLLLWSKGNYDVLPDLKNTYPIKKVARALQMCKMENSDFFVNAIGGQELYSREEFLEYGIQLKFVKTNEFTYRQFDDTFVPDLSIIDVLMHNGKEATKQFLNEYTLI